MATDNSWLDILHSAFAHPVERLQDVEDQLLGKAKVPSAPAQTPVGRQGSVGSPGASAYCPEVLPSDNAGLVRLAALRGLALLNPSQNEGTNVQPYVDDFAKVANPNAVNTQNWTPAFTDHGTAIESPRLPGYSDYAIKMYNDPNLGNTAALVYPTGDPRHTLYYPAYKFGFPVNAWFAKDFLDASVGMCPPIQSRKKDWP